MFMSHFSLFRFHRCAFVPAFCLTPDYNDSSFTMNIVLAILLSTLLVKYSANRLWRVMASDQELMQSAYHWVRWLFAMLISRNLTFNFNFTVLLPELRYNKWLQVSVNSPRNRYWPCWGSWLFHSTYVCRTLAPMARSRCRRSFHNSDGTRK